MEEEWRWEWDGVGNHMYKRKEKNLKEECGQRNGKEQVV